MRTKLILIILSLLLVQSFSFGQKFGKKKEISLTGTTFYLKNVASGNKYIDIPGAGYRASKKNGTKIQLWDMDSGQDRQVKFIPAGGGWYYIRFQHANMNMDVHGCFKGKLFCGTYKHKKGAEIQIWNAGTSEPQQWRIDRVRKGQYRIVNRYSGKVLDASGSNVHKNGCKIVQWDWHGGDNQIWELVEVKSGARYMGN